MRVQKPSRHSMHYMNLFSVLDNVFGVVHSNVVDFRALDDPPIVHILKLQELHDVNWLVANNGFIDGQVNSKFLKRCLISYYWFGHNYLKRITCHLLLMRRPPSIRILDGIILQMGVKPTSPSQRVTQRHLRTMHDLDGLSLNDRRQTALQARLEGWGHHRIVGTSVRQHAQVDVEDWDVSGKEGEVKDAKVGDEFGNDLEWGQVLPWDPAGPKSPKYQHGGQAEVKGTNVFYTAKLVKSGLGNSLVRCIEVEELL